MNRRDFLIGMSAAAVSGTASQAQPAAQSSSLAFASALKAADAIRKKQISSVELTRLVFDRIDRYNPKLNAFAYQLREDALAKAANADKAPDKSGAFHGVPIFVKESFAVAGYPCTWGLPAFRNTKAPRNSAVVDRLLGAGAILVGGTNVPVNLFDWQTYNEIYGTTNNPWDVKRTPGGSSGGTAAALAAGLGFLSVGSDIGGSIRVPAHFCGVYGHKPTLDLVDMARHSPGGNDPLPGFSTLLAVAGPMARSAEDLITALKILGGASGYDAKAWKWQLPEPRARKISDFRVGYVIDDSFARPTTEVRRVLEKTIEALTRAGAQMKPGWPASIRPADLLANYRFMLEAFTASVSSPQEVKQMQQELGTLSVGAAGSSFVAWQQQNFRRLAFRAQWQGYFQQADVFLTPVAFTPAFPHDHSVPSDSRVIASADGPKPYMELFNWIAAPTLTGCPATVAPVGLTDAGLPVGIQIMGPYWEDATPLEFAALLAKEIGGFTPPPGYQG